MKREIKFRGKRIYNGEWVYGFLIGNIDPTKGHTEYRSWFIHNGVSISEAIQVDPPTVEQLATTCEQLEIYRGDILKSLHFNDGHKDHFLYHVVEWSDKYMCWTAKNVKNNSPDPNINGNTQLWVYLKNTQFEIVGNVHDNPELLK